MKIYLEITDLFPIVDIDTQSLLGKSKEIEVTDEEYASIKRIIGEFYELQDKLLELYDWWSA